LWLTLFVLAALLAPWISPHDPLAQDLMLGRLPPAWVAGAEPGYWLGTDSLGRDVLSRIIHGARIALVVALIAGTATCLLGSALGLVAGFYRGWADRLISRLVDIWMAFPPVLFAILLIAVLGTGLTSVILAIVIIDWTRFCRVVRAETLNQSKMDYVHSAKVAGFTRLRTLATEILPNVLPTIIALLTLEMGIAVIVEAILSFVNLSISTDQPTWGGMIAEGRTSIHQAWWVLVFPLIALFLTVLSFAQFGDGLRERFDPVLR
jgi:peptide/nickel transport system permease protein